MRIAVIDLGTNTFHLLIAEVNDTSFTVIHRMKIGVKIGERGINQGYIVPEAIERAKEALLRFKRVMKDFLVENIYTTATSAIRNAKNGKALAYELEQLIGIKIRIITGHEEAEFIYYGVKHAMDLGDEVSLVMDIGGGSIELIIGNAHQEYWKESYEVGGQRLVERFQKNDPISLEEIDGLQSYLDEELIGLKTVIAKYQPTVLVGSSGTFDTLSEIYQMENGIEKKLDQTEFPLPYSNFKAMLKSIISKNKEERLLIPGMIELRVDMIVVASLLVNYILDVSQIKKLRVSAYALKEGVLLHTLHNIFNNQKTIKIQDYIQ